MARSQETFSKKEREKKKRKKKKEKAERKEQRKAEAADGKSFEDMIMYVDEFGNFTETPPDPAKKSKVRKEDIEVSVPKSGSEPEPTVRNGKVKFFNEEKGYGFILDQFSNDSIFVHAQGLVDQIRDNDRVQFEIEMGQRGPVAVNVQVTN